MSSPAWAWRRSRRMAAPVAPDQSCSSMAAAPLLVALPRSTSMFKRLDHAVHRRRRRNAGSACRNWQPTGRLARPMASENSALPSARKVMRSSTPRNRDQACRTNWSFGNNPKKKKKKKKKKNTKRRKKGKKKKRKKKKKEKKRGEKKKKKKKNRQHRDAVDAPCRAKHRNCR